MFSVSFSPLSVKKQDQGGEARKLGPQVDPAEEEEGVESGDPEEEGPEEPRFVLEERRGLPLPAAGQLGKPVSNHGSQDGKTAPSDEHPQVGQVQQRVQKGPQETQDPQMSRLPQCLQIK